MSELLGGYIEYWKGVEGVKPCNDAGFIEDFMQFAELADAGCWNFSGDNGYCGYTAELHENYMWRGDGLCFEFAYGKDFVKVFTARHGGFWTPEYISLKGDDAKALLELLKRKLEVWAGFAT